MASDQNNHLVQMTLLEPGTLKDTEQTCGKKFYKKFCKKPKYWIAAIFLSLLLVTIISLVLYSAVYVDEDENLFNGLKSNKTCTFTGSLNLANPCLRNTWITNKTTFLNMVSNVFSTSPSLQYYFLGATIDYDPGDERKSAIIHLQFASAAKPLEYPISAELVKGVLVQNMHEHENSACQHSTALWNAFQVTLPNL
ncbi:TPA-induced transmembrane protein [Hyperolius riggenbachi]|uniref:TPA-induced transmembrane protein n=1 Tax=Hyperolius riggenbachi TaxID=752182 RepID=UPI0035A2A3A3